MKCFARAMHSVYYSSKDSQDGWERADAILSLIGFSLSAKEDRACVIANFADELKYLLHYDPNFWKEFLTEQDLVDYDIPGRITQATEFHQSLVKRFLSE